MHLTCFYQGPQGITKSGEAKTLLLRKCFYTHTIHASTPPTQEHRPFTQSSTPFTQAYQPRKQMLAHHSRHTL